MAQAVNGMVFDIRELAIHDGPGVRTTVFLKGCPLRCAWCHNPEGLRPEPETMRSAAGPRAVGRRYGAAELAAILNRQAPLLAGRGGVTFSGGEPLMQAGFLAAVIDQLDDGLHVAVETAGQASPEDFRAVIVRCDLVLFDLKLADPAAHHRWTGSGNEAIRRNLSLLAASDIPFTVRVPLVPGVTDTGGNLRAIADIVAGLARPAPIELLPFNRLAGAKHAACGLAWEPGFDEQAAADARLDVFRHAGLEASLA